MGRVRALVAGLVLATVLGCAHATNYPATGGPAYRGTAPATADSVESLRIVTFNIAWGRKFQQAAIGLGSHPDLCGAHLIMLQEMDSTGVQWIAAALGMSYVYYPSSREKDGRDMGEAILSRWPIEESGKLTLPHTTRIVHRAHAAVKARIRIGGRAVHVYSVHLGSPLGLSGHSRRDEVEAILADADSVDEPVIIAGDFNSKGIGDAFVKRGYAWPTRDVGHSVMLFSYDHVFLRGVGEPTKAGIARELDDASDHRPVWVTVRL